MAHDVCLTALAFGVGLFVCALRLGALGRRERRIARAYYDRCRVVATKVETIAGGSIRHLTTILGRRIGRRFDRRLRTAELDLLALRDDIEQLQRRAFAQDMAEARAEGFLDLDEPATLRLKEGTNGTA